MPVDLNTANPFAKPTGKPGKAKPNTKVSPVPTKRKKPKKA